ncbi:conjugal transfer protein TraG, partial [Proteus mirabilis]|nr:conjugal transfer protein TraG [Proteus mirabilis]
MKSKMNNAVGPQVRKTKRSKKGLYPSLAAISVFAGLQSATQFFADRFNYQQNLGDNFNHVYLPWSIIKWASD